MSKETVEINPEFQDIYSWELVPTAKHIDLVSKIPNGFDPSKIEVKLNEDKTAIAVHYPQQPPILAGKLFGQIVSADLIKDEKSFTVRVNYDAPSIPQVLIVDYHPENGEIDPLSAFLQYQYRSMSNDDSVRNGCFEYLQVGLEYCFPPSMIAAVSILQRMPQMEAQVFEILTVAADRYNYPSAQLQLGLSLINQPHLRKRAFEYIEKASAEPELPVASAILGVILSPISDLEFENKDAVRAVSLFEDVLKTERIPMALHELAMLLYNGIGVEKDIERAKKLNEECLKLENATPELEIRDENYKPKPPQHQSCCCCCHDH